MTSKTTTNLRIPGPVPLPDDVLGLIGSQMINHRGSEYADMLDRMTTHLKTVLMTKNDAYFITASGTGSMEASIVNTLSPGDKVLSIIIGVFGERYAEIVEAYGGDVTRLEFPLGTAADPDAVRDVLKKIGPCKAVVITHNESSTGVANPLQKLCQIIQNESDALILVDAVSSGAGMPIAVDAWGIDVVATASQKSWIAPPGIAMLSFSSKAWEAYNSSSIPKYYLDIKQYKDYLSIGQPPFTPCLPTMFALEKSLEDMVSEGIENIFSRHKDIAEHTRDGARSLGLEILPEEHFASDTVTAIKLPQDIDGREFLNRVERDYNVVLGGGQKSLTGKIFRVGHMGQVSQMDIDTALEAAGRTIKQMRG